MTILSNYAHFSQSFRLMIAKHPAPQPLPKVQSAACSHHNDSGLLKKVHNHGATQIQKVCSDN